MAKYFDRLGHQTVCRLDHALKVGEEEFKVRLPAQPEARATAPKVSRRGSARLSAAMTFREQEAFVL
jgi:hypothetical protein